VVERQLPKLNVAGSIPVSRSKHLVPIQGFCGSCSIFSTIQVTNLSPDTSI
jgi:hypothetical protein